MNFIYRKMRRLALLAAIFGPAVAGAEMPVTFVQDGRALFTLSAPDFWQVRAGGPRSVIAPETGEARQISRVIGFEPAADQGVWVGFMAPNGVGTMQEARDYLSNIGGLVVSDPQVSDRMRIRIGGLPAERYAGTGRRAGRKVGFTAVLIDLPGRGVAVSLAVMEARADPSLVADINAIYRSFRAVR